MPGPTDEMIRRVLKALSFDLTDHLWWRQVGDEPLRLFINANDFFFWACADVEPIETLADVELLEQAIADCKSATSEPYPNEGPMLYCSRHRGLRPQQPYYKYLDARTHELFNAAGPERTRESEG